MRPVVYTALYGAYHESIPPAPFLGVPAIAFVDRERVAPGWKQVVVPMPPDIHPRLQAKFFKLMPHKLFKDYDVSIWLDASWQVREPTIAFDLAEFTRAHSLAFFPHRWRKTIVAEAEATLQHPKYAGLPVREQTQHYLDAGYPDDRGLMECTCLVRRHHEPDAAAFDEAWWDECARWTVCDQQSAPYVAWKLGTAFAWLPYTLDTQPWFKLAAWRADI